jgi:ABC-type sugar transport system ATPase subunit
MATAPLWEFREITKRFPGVVANDRVSLCLFPGEIHGLMGENGSGKSTLIKMLSGAYQPTGGTILKKGEPVVLASPITARGAGIATVFQEFSVVPTLSVAENIYLGRWPRRGSRVDWDAMRLGARRALATMDVDIDADILVGGLSVAEQQLIEIAKALESGASMLILDEPTTALGLTEIERLHGLLRRLKDRGVSILYVSHRLDEVVALVDKVTVLKDGKVVATADGTDISVPFIVEKMVGDVGTHYPKKPAQPGDVLLRIEDLVTSNRVAGVSFSVRRGEVFAIGGVLGSGRTEVARALFGLDPVISGTITWKGKETRFKSPREAIEAGLALVPENRKFDGLFFNFTGFPNMTSAALHRLGGRGLLSPEREAEAGRKLIKDLAIVPTAETKEVGALSGGNQQKIVIGRWLFAGAELFILDEPTQGIDIAAKIAVYRLINRLTDMGKSVILISSDHEELLSMSDRVGIMSHGRMVAVRDAASVSKSDLVKASAVVTSHAA